MGKHEKTDVTEADRQLTNGAESNAKPDQDEVGPVSGEAEERDTSEDQDAAQDQDTAGDQDSEGGESGELSRQPGADPEDEEEIEEERKQRLDPENRPEHAEVDNSDREFDAEKGMYTDSEGYEQAEEKFPPMGEQGA